MPLPHRREFLTELEKVSRSIDDPAAKLRYLRTSLSRYESMGLERVKGARMRKVIHRLTSLEALTDTLGVGALRHGGAEARALRRYRLARATAALAAAAVVVALTGVGVATWSARQPVAASTPAERPRPVVLPPVAEELPRLPAGVGPKAVWLVEKGDRYEQFSNGLRVDTSFEVAGQPRRFRSFRIGLGLEPEVSSQPVGILFHTTESDIWPLEAGFNENLRDSSQRLLRYLKRESVYHYLIDRFGRVFRVVDEASKANHAGHSVWAHGERVYLNLNHAFLGVSFETRWEGGRSLPITEAQLTAGRNLTDQLRQRYAIAPEMCVAHGLTSVNPQKLLIGHHLDWARGFPFAAFGLPDQYERLPPSVALFGFGYDDKLTSEMGEPWPGVGRAQTRLEEEARRLGTTSAELRRRRQALYERWRAEQVQDEQAARATAARTASKEIGG
ncbi:MAG: N-acetylmuramoyl-L-alanine amidase [Vicinamibacteria bacterium]